MKGFTDVKKAIDERFPGMRFNQAVMRIIRLAYDMGVEQGKELQRATQPGYSPSIPPDDPPPDRGLMHTYDVKRR